MPEQDLNLESNSVEKESNLPQEEIVGGQLQENREELQEIIERNRAQVEKIDGNFEVEKQQEAQEKIEQNFALEKPETASSSAAQDDDQDDDKEEKQHIQTHAETIYQIADPEQQIEHIVQLAITKDPYFAVKVARHLDDNYILNEVHDRLVEDQVREELIKKGLLQEN